MVADRKFVMKVPEGTSLTEAELIQKLAAWQNIRLLWPDLYDNSALWLSRGIPRPVVVDADNHMVAVGFWEFVAYLQKEGLVLL